MLVQRVGEHDLQGGPAAIGDQGRSYRLDHVLIKACLNEFAPRGLRLIEVDKTDLVDLPDIVDLIAERPERFIVFCDDLSFDEGEPGYKALKSILDRTPWRAEEPVVVVEFMASDEGLHLSLAFMRIKDVKVRKRVLSLVRQLAEGELW